MGTSESVSNVSADLQDERRDWTTLNHSPLPVNFLTPVRIPSEIFSLRLTERKSRSSGEKGPKRKDEEGSKDELLSLVKRDYEVELERNLRGAGVLTVSSSLETSVDTLEEERQVIVGRISLERLKERLGRRRMTLTLSKKSWLPAAPVFWPMPVVGET